MIKDGSFLIWTILIPLFYGVLHFKKIKRFKWIYFYICYGTINQIAGMILVKAGLNNTLFLSHLYVVVSFIFLVLFYKVELTGFLKPSWFKITLFIFGIFFLINLLFIQSFNEYPNMTFAISSLIVVVMALLYFNKIMIESRIEKLTDEPLVWISTGILIFYTGNFFFHILFNALLKTSTELLISLALFFRILIAILYILIAIGFWKVKKAETAGNLLR